MKFFALICATLCCAALTGCVHHGHHRHGGKLVVPTKVVVPVPVVVETSNGNKHCPPGQAKKGKC